jgi:hypothetical protein
LEQQYKEAKDLADETLQRVDVYTNTRPEFSASDESELESARTAVTGRDWLLIDELERKKQMYTNWDSLHNETNYRSLKAAYLKQLEEENRLSQAWHNASEESDLYAQTIEIVTGRLQNWPTTQPQMYFNNLPIPLAIVKTDADGKFSLQISQKGEFTLVAQAQRQVSDNTEKYFWLVRVHSDGKSEMQVMLSNDNLITANSSDVAVRFPTP